VILIGLEQKRAKPRIRHLMYHMEVWPLVVYKSQKQVMDVRQKKVSGRGF